MSSKNIVQRQDGMVFIENCMIADTAWRRMVGLLGKDSLEGSCGLWITPCTSVHTLFMKFSIDAIFIDKKGKVIRIYENLRPWRLTFLHPFAIGVLETMAGHAKEKGLNVGDTLKICSSS